METCYNGKLIRLIPGGHYRRLPDCSSHNWKSLADAFTDCWSFSEEAYSQSSEGDEQHHLNNKLSTGSLDEEAHSNMDSEEPAGDAADNTGALEPPAAEASDKNEEVKTGHRYRPPQVRVVKSSGHEASRIRYYDEAVDAYNPAYFGDFSPGRKAMPPPMNMKKRSTQPPHKRLPYVLRQPDPNEYQPLYYGHEINEAESFVEIGGVRFEKIEGGIGYATSVFSVGVLAATGFVGFTAAAIATSLANRILDKHY